MATGTTGTGGGGGSGKSKWMWLAKLAGFTVVVFLGYALLLYHQTHMIVESVSQAVGGVMAANQQRQDVQSADVFGLRLGPDGKGEGFVKFQVQGKVEPAKVNIVPSDAWRGTVEPPVVVVEQTPPPPTETPARVYQAPQSRQVVRCQCTNCHRGQQQTAARPVVTHWIGRDLQP